MAYDVFISYSRKDKEKAEALCTALEEAGISYWIDRNIHGAANFLSQITAYMKSCKVVVFVASANSAKSKWTQKEILYALKCEKEIVPYRIGDFQFKDNDELDFVFTNVQWVESVSAVVESLKELGCATASQEPPQLAPAPTHLPRKPFNFEPLRNALATSGVGLVVEGVVETISYVKEQKRIAEEERIAEERRKAEEERKAWEYRLSGKGNNGVYDIGYYYDDGVKQGVVFEVTADGQHGKIVSLTETKIDWAKDKNFGGLFRRENPAEKFAGTVDKRKGANNMSKVQQIDGWREKYPAFAWCADLGEGWYLPALEELKKFTLDEAIHDAVNSTLATRGKRIANKGRRYTYWSSTEADGFDGFDGSRAWYVGMNHGGTGTFYKSYGLYVRAVATF